MSAYGAFAEVYDLLMDDFDYPQWTDYYLKLIEFAGKIPKSVCDCACGTGSVSIELAARGLNVTGVDISREMLERAMQKARLNGIRMPFVCQDICALQLPRPVDAIICACDGVNYLLTEQRLRAFFTQAHRALKPGGVLAFDISTRYKLEQVIGSAFFGEERDRLAYLWSNAYDREKRLLKMDITFFAERPDGLYERFSEIHTQRAHEPDELLEILKQCGFQSIRVYGDRTFDAPKEDTQRVHFTAVCE